MDQMLVVVAADPGSSTGRLVAQRLRRRGHRVRRLAALGDAAVVADAVAGAQAIVLVPRRGDPERHAHGAVRTLIAAADPGAHVLLVSSFAVGYGESHPFNRVLRVLPGLLAAERAMQAGGLPYTIVRAAWLTDDPPRAHALTFTQDQRPDGMLARADLAAALVAAIEHPGARNTTFTAFNEPGPPERRWAWRFAHLQAVAT
jgi:uncharacterized protein YbjT (DUF2867 family)